jgi:nucleoside-diphosphate-sugar epimerase
VEKRQISIRSSGRAWKNFIAMDDVVRALVLAARDLPAGLYNAGSRRSTTVLGVAERVSIACGYLFGFAPPIRAAAAQPGEGDAPLDFRIEKLVAAGFTPSASPDEELRRTLMMARELFGCKEGDAGGQR